MPLLVRKQRRHGAIGTKVSWHFLPSQLPEHMPPWQTNESESAAFFLCGRECVLTWYDSDDYALLRVYRNLFFNDAMPDDRSDSPGAGTPVRMKLLPRFPLHASTCNWVLFFNAALSFIELNVTFLLPLIIASSNFILQ